METAAPLAAAAGLECHTHDGICEYDRRGAEYVPYEALKVENYDAWRALATGEHGHDMEAFCADVVAGLEHIIGRHAGERVAVFCHGGVINVWTAHLLGMTARLFFEPKYASISRFACARSGERSVVSLNEHVHLAAPP